jgi:hypothetical protein
MPFLIEFNSKYPHAYRHTQNVYGSKIPRIFNVRALEHLSVAL